MANTGAVAVNDVVPDRAGGWVATCECGARRRFAEVEAGWEWVLTHPCLSDDED